MQFTNIMLLFLTAFQSATESYHLCPYMIYMICTGKMAGKLPV